jgi:23S rRNA pseudouridine955/2504/2580 synthase
LAGYGWRASSDAQIKEIIDMAGVQLIQVDPDEAGMRLDRWFKIHFPGLGFGQLQKLLRSGQIRVDGGRVKTDARVQPGQTVRVPPLGVDEKSTGPLTAKTIRNRDDGDVLSQMLLHEDPKVLVFNKPAGLAVQGGSGVTRNVDEMLEAWRNKKGEKPRLVHRLDRDTAGVLVVARTRGAAQALTAAFRERTTKKTYWALVKGVPRTKEGKISTWLIKEATEDGDRMRIAKHGEQGADHAVSYYRVIDKAAQNLAWLEFEPYTGRTHQLRVHALHLGHPIIGDPKYFEFDKNWEFPSGMQNRLHLLARHISIPHPDGGRLSVTAPLPPHMVQSWNLLGFDEAAGGEHEE